MTKTHVLFFIVGLFSCYSSGTSKTKGVDEKSIDSTEESNDTERKEATNEPIGQDISDCFLNEVFVNLVDFTSIDVKDNNDFDSYQKITCDFFNSHFKNGSYGFEYDCGDATLYAHSILPDQCAIIIIEKDNRINNLTAYYVSFNNERQVETKFVLSENNSGSGGSTFSKSKMIGSDKLEKIKIDGFVGAYIEATEKYQVVVDSIRTVYSIKVEGVQILEKDSLRSMN